MQIYLQLNQSKYGQFIVLEIPPFKMF